MTAIVAFAAPGSSAGGGIPVVVCASCHFKAPVSCAPTAFPGSRPSARSSCSNPTENVIGARRPCSASCSGLRRLGFGLWLDWAGGGDCARLANSAGWSCAPPPGRQSSHQTSALGDRSSENSRRPGPGSRFDRAMRPPPTGGGGGNSPARHGTGRSAFQRRGLQPPRMLSGAVERAGGLVSLPLARHRHRRGACQQ